MNNLRLRLYTVVSVACVGLLGCYVLTAVINVIARYLFNAPLAILNDFAEIFVPMSLALAFPAAALKGSHLAIRFLGSLVGPAAARWLDILGKLATLVLMIAITVKLADYAEEIATSGRATTQHELLLWPVWAFVTGAFAIAVVGTIITPPRPADTTPNPDPRP